MDDATGREIADNLKRKNELLRRMLEITQLQQAMLDRDDGEGVLRLLDERSGIMGKIDSLDGTRKRLMRVLSAKAAAELAEKTPEIRQYDGEIRGVVGKLQQADEQLKSAMQLKLEEYGRNARKLREVRQGIDSYTGAGGQSDGIYLDVRK